MNAQYLKVTQALQATLNVSASRAQDLIRSLNFAKLVELNSAVKSDNMDAVKEIFAVKEADNAFSTFDNPSKANAFTPPTASPQQPAGAVQSGTPATGQKLTISSTDGTEAVVDIEQQLPDGSIKVRNAQGTETINLDDMEAAGMEVAISEDVAATSSGDIAATPQTLGTLIKRKLKNDANPG